MLKTYIWRVNSYDFKKQSYKLLIEFNLYFGYTIGNKYYYEKLYKY